MADLEHGTGWPSSAKIGDILRDTSWPLRALLLLALLLPALLAGWFAWQHHAAVLADAEKTAQRSVVALEEHAAIVLQQHSLILQQVVRMTEGKSPAQIAADARLQQTIAALAGNFKVLSSLGITDAEGKVLISSNKQAGPILQVADRDYFAEHKNGTAHGLFFSEPYTGRQNGVRQIAVSIARTTPSGVFDGIAYAAVPLDYFTDFWQKFAPSDGYLIPLIRGDGTLLLRYPASNNPERLNPNGPFLTRVRQQPRGMYTAVSQVDAVERINAYSQVADYPMYISFSIETRTALQEWRDDVLPVFFWAAVAAAALVALWLVVVRQAYQQRASARQWHETARRLESEVARRKEAEEALRQGQKMEAIGQLAGGIAHDFNNLLAGIVGNLQLMRIRLTKGQLDELQRHIGAAESVADKAKAMTQRLLTFSRHHALRPQVTRVNDRISFMQELIEHTAGPAIRIQMALAADLWNTLCDPNQLETALLNLAINARDAMPNGGQLTFATANTSLSSAEANAVGVAPGRYVTISVIDTGIGMPPEVLRRAFDPFFTTKPIGQGTGLGLSMIYGFVKQSGGGVRIESTPGTGTTVKIYLPMTTEALPDKSVPAASQEAPTHGVDGSVLLVEDDAVLGNLLSEMLTDLGYRVLHEKDSTQGLAVLQSAAAVDLLISDIGLPGSMNGLQLVDAARTLRPGIKILLITGYTEMMTSEESGLRAAGMEIMTKPFDLDSFGKNVGKLLQA